MVHSVEKCLSSGLFVKIYVIDPHPHMGLNTNLKKKACLFNKTYSCGKI